MTKQQRRDDGFTLPEMLIAVVLMATLASVIALTIITSIRTAPSVASRSDTAIAVQGITTFLPPDVDSTEPDAFDTTSTTASGCAGTDRGTNIVHMSWSEEFFGNTTNYVANYRFVVDGNGGYIIRVACSGQFVLGAPNVLDMSAKISTNSPTVDLFDSDGDGETDTLKITIETFSGDLVFIDAASKNPAETLPPVVTNPSTTTTTTATVNQAPHADPTAVTIETGVVTTVNLLASDPDGDSISITSVSPVPPGWVVIPGATGNAVSITPVAAAPGVYNMTYTVVDVPGGLPATNTLDVTVSATPVTTTTTTTTTSTTLPPPCIVSGVSANPSTVNLKSSDPSKLKRSVDVVANVTGGYCVGLVLRYDTGAPNGQYVQNLGNAPPYDVTLIGHPHGTELWTVGVHTLEVRDGSGNVLATTTLTVIPK